MSLSVGGLRRVAEGIERAATAGEGAVTGGEPGERGPWKDVLPELRPGLVLLLAAAAASFTLLILALIGAWRPSHVVLTTMGALGGGFIGYAAASARLRLPMLEDYVTVSTLFEAKDEHGLALQWIQRARDQFPKHAGLLLKEAKLLLQVGAPDIALQRIREANKRGRDGWTAFRTAQILDEAGHEANDVEAYLWMALQRTPSLVKEWKPGQFPRIDKARVLESLGINEDLFKDWGERPSD